MPYSVVLDGQVIGHSELESNDLSMGVVFGRFLPTDAYRKVQPVFLLFLEERHKAYYDARDALNLELRSDGGSTVPTVAIHICDHSNDAGVDSMELEVHLTDASSWRQSRSP